MTLAVSANLAATAQILGLGEVSTTLYVGDTHIKDVGRQTFLTNSFVGGFVATADHPLLATLTRGLYLDEIMTRESERNPYVRLQGMGDFTDTPSDEEAAVSNTIFERHPIPMDGCDMENHGSSNAWGVVNLLSKSYNWLKRHIFGRLGLLDLEFSKAVGGTPQILTPRDTIKMAHSLIHRTRPNGSTPDSLNIRVTEKETKSGSIRFSDCWKQSPVDQSYWECLVNYDTADKNQAEREGRTPTIYLQAHERRFHVDGRDIPVFDISMDTQDHNHLLAIMPGISEFQVGLVESFMEERLKKNPSSIFRLSAHFPLSGVSGFFTSCGEKAALKRLLSRSEVVFVVGAHTHDRAVTDLKKTLRLNRSSPLTEVTLPTIVKYSPWQSSKGAPDQTAQAIGIHRMWVEKDDRGTTVLKIAHEFGGVNPEEIRTTDGVREAVASYSADHGYLTADVAKKAARRFAWVFLKRQMRRLGAFFTQAMNPVSKKKVHDYWKEDSMIRNAVDNLTAVSVTETSERAKRLMPFLESLIHFLDVEPSPEALAVRGNIQGVLTALSATCDETRKAFEEAVARGEDPHRLRRFDTYLADTGVNQLPKFFLDLPRGSLARHYALLTGMEVARAEYQFHRGKPTKIPNQVPTITIQI